MKTQKDYSWSMTVESPEGKIEYINEYDPSKGYKRSWYKTEAAARKALNINKAFQEKWNYRIVSWMIFNRYHDIGVIEAYSAE